MFKWDIKIAAVKKITMVCISLVFCPLLTSSAGVYYLSFFDNFVSSVPFSLGAVIEYYIFVYMFPFSEL